MVNSLKELKIDDKSFINKVNELDYENEQENLDKLRIALTNLQKEFHLLTFAKQKLNVEQSTKDLIGQQ
jgi:hypothetical protein